MGKLVKARLIELVSSGNKVLEKEAVDVQFNPTTLRLSITNSVRGGASPGNQTRQTTGTSSVTLSMDLVFDTADEGTTDNPKSVREKTRLVEKFVLPPKGSNPNHTAPPMVRFDWNGRLTLDGQVDSINIDFDLFASDGTPLRAKVSLTIKEINRNYVYVKTGSGSQPKGSAGNVANTAPALASESAAEFAARNGLDPSRWRSLDFGGANPLDLPPGLDIGFSPGISGDSELGLSVGVNADLSVSLEASFGLEAGLTVKGGTGADIAGGLALAAGGGVQAALASIQNGRNEQAILQTRQSFGESLGVADSATNGAGFKTSGGTVQAVEVSKSAGEAGSASSSTRKPSAPEQPRPALAGQGTLPTSTQQKGVSGAPPLPRVDPRVASFGFGIPLRTVIGAASKQRVACLQGHPPLSSKRDDDGLPPLTRDPTVPPWVALPAPDAGRRLADKRQQGLTPKRPCGCTQPCNHRGGF